MKLTRSQNKVFSGVLAGFAEYFGWDVSLTRIAYVILTVFTGFFAGILIYIAAAIIMPDAE